MKKLTRKELTRKQAGQIKGGLACDELNNNSCREIPIAVMILCFVAIGDVINNLYL